MPGVFDPLADVLPAEVIERMHIACATYNHHPDTRRPGDTCLTAGIRPLVDYRADASRDAEVKRLEWNWRQAQADLEQHKQNRDLMLAHLAAAVDRCWALVVAAGSRKKVDVADLVAALQPVDPQVSALLEQRQATLELIAESPVITGEQARNLFHGPRP